MLEAGWKPIPLRKSFFHGITMRLTLRTLLAYRDGVLDSGDAAVLEAKIKDSSTAQQISKRIADEMQNRRLAPIPVDAREFGFEANTVAEFLDDTISMETLPEMERKCLENNTLLSEIGSCHQILTRALSIPATIPVSLRQRIHELPNSTAAIRLADSAGRIRRVDKPELFPETAAENQIVALALQSAKPMRKPNVELRHTGIELNDGLGRQVPEYLIGSDRGWIKTAALGLFLLVTLVLVGSMAIGPVERVRDLLRKSELIAAPGVDGKPSEPTVTPEKNDTVSFQPSDIASPTLKSSDASSNAPAETLKRAEAVSLDLSKPEGNSKADVIALPSKPSALNRIQWLPDTKPSAQAIVLKSSRLGNSSEFAWNRMVSGEFIHPGERVIVPPSQRTEMQVEPGIRLLCAGENDLELVGDGAMPHIAMRTGRALLFATPDAKAIELDCNGLSVSIRFRSSEGSCAMEIQNGWAASATETPQSVGIATRSSVRLFGVQGELDFSSMRVDVSAGKGTLRVGQFVDWSEGAQSDIQELAEAPWWFSSSTDRPIDQAASEELQKAITAKTPEELESQLLARAKQKPVSTAALAARIRMMLSRFDGLFEPDGIFNRKEMQSFWPSLVSQIPQSLARDEYRAELVKALRTACPDRADTILSLLIPPTPEQLSNGVDKLLVDALSSQHLDERVLAISQLTRITGKSQGYHPERPQADVIQKWRKLLTKSEIQFSEQPKL